ncbi:MAG TPA: SIR2 family protein [Longimicrobium sp.]
MSTLATILADRQNRVAFDELCKAMRRRGPRPIAMVGAGTSVALGYPSWDALLDRLDERAAEAMRGARQQAAPPVKDYPDKLWRAQEYRRRMGEVAFGRALQAIFRPNGNAAALVDDLVRLPFSHFITTNYDQALEDAHQRVFQREPPSINWDDRDEVVEFITRVADPTWRRRYVHLHGRWDRPDSIVLSDADYTRRYVQSDDTPKKLFAIFALRRFVFIGFSLSDPDLMAVLREVAARIGGVGARHFALVGYERGENLEMHRSRFMSKFGVAPVFFETTGRDFTGLPLLIRALLEECGRQPKAATAPSLTTMMWSPIVGRQHSAEHARDMRSREEFRELIERIPISESLTDLRSLSGRWSMLDESFAEPPPLNPDDPHKHRFGGKPAAGGKVLRAHVKPVGDGEWFEVRLEVSAEPTAPPLEGSVTFHLHPTFVHDRIEQPVKDGAARVKLVAWGAFTVGAETSDGTRLELDLAELPSAPMAFRMR